MAASGRGDRYKPDRLFFPQNTTFHVTIASKADDNTKLQQAVAAFWLLTHLGGIGSRSRRCAGSVTAQVTDDNLAGLCFDIPKDVEDLQDQISEGIKIAQTLAKQGLHHGALTSAMQASFDTLAQKACKIWILRDGNRAWRTPDAAMRAIGSNLQSYRSDLPLESRTVFGLPLIGIDNRSRHASPLLLRIVELQGEVYVGIAVLFKTGGDQNYTLIEKWANSFPGKIEVTL
jgi:CRISPR-associated protein Cmr1